MVDGMYQAAGRVLTSISVGSSVVTGECERTEQVESGNNIPMSATAGHLLLLAAAAAANQLVISTLFMQATLAAAYRENISGISHLTAAAGGVCAEA